MAKKTKAKTVSKNVQVGKTRSASSTDVVKLTPTQTSNVSQTSQSVPIDALVDDSNDSSGDASGSADVHDVAAESAAPLNTKQSTKYFLIVLGVLILLVLSFWGASKWYAQLVAPPTVDEMFELGAHTNTSTYYTYNGFTFVQDPVTKFWLTWASIPHKNEVIQLETYFAPHQLGSVPYDNQSVLAILTKPNSILLLTNSLNSDPSGGSAGGIAAIEVGKIIGTRYGLLNIRARSAVTPDMNRTEGLLLATCENVTATQSIISFSLGNETAVFEEDGCVHVVGATPQDLILASNRLMFGILGVMR